MRKHKKLIFIFVIAIFVLFFIRLTEVKFSKSEFLANIGKNNQEDNVDVRYYYSQLENNSKAQMLYNVMKEMYLEGVFKEGKDYDLVENGYITQAQITDYINGNNELMTQMEIAKRAFEADYPEAFYIDFSYVTIRVTVEDLTNMYHAYLGSGRAESYFANGITTENIESKIIEYEEEYTGIEENLDNVSTQEVGQSVQLMNYIKREANYWKTFSEPELLENLDIFDKSNIALASEVIAQLPKMKNMIEAECGRTILASRNYNLKLMADGAEIENIDTKLKVATPFPVGYDIDSKDVTYKAYYFIEDDEGEILDVKEMPCVVTPYGLVTLCDTFGKVSIVAVQYYEVSLDKIAIISSTEGGSIIGSDRNLSTISQGELQEISITPNKGYAIEKVFIAGKEMNTQIEDVEKQEESIYYISYEDIENGNNIIYVTFVAQSVLNKDIERGEKAVFQKPKNAEILMGQQELACELEEDITIAPSIKTYNGIHAYQWYKNGNKIIGETSKTLNLYAINQNSVGKYSLVVTTTLGATTVKTESTYVELTIKQEEDISAKVSLNTEKSEISDDEELIVEIRLYDVQVKEKGISKLSTKLTYDDLLTFVGIEPQNGWSIASNDGQNITLVTNREDIVEDAIISRIVFKPSLLSVGGSNIILEDIVISNGNAESNIGNVMTTVYIIPKEDMEENQEENNYQENYGEDNSEQYGTQIDSGSNTEYNPNEDYNTENQGQKTEKKAPSTAGTTFPGSTNENANENSSVTTDEVISTTTKSDTGTYSAGISSVGAETKKDKKNGGVGLIIVCIAIIGGVAFVIKKKVIDVKDRE